MSFERPWMLLLIFAPFIAEYLWLKNRLLRPVFSLQIWGALKSDSRSSSKAVAAFIRNVCVCAGYIFMIIAAAGPVKKENLTTWFSRGDDVIFAIDVSPSMGAKDLLPDRFGAAISMVDEFLSPARNEAVGIVAFGTEAALVCPPTLDYAALNSRLEKISPGILGNGTAIGTGLAVAIRHMIFASGKRKHIVLITDGEENSGAITSDEAVLLAARNGIRVNIIGIGSHGEVPVEYRNPESGEYFQGMYKSTFNETHLKDLADLTKGFYMNVKDEQGVGRAFGELASEIPSASIHQISGKKTSSAHEWFAISCCLLFLGWILELVFLGIKI